jgi:hypothetical protein
MVCIIQDNHHLYLTSIQIYLCYPTLSILFNSPLEMDKDILDILLPLLPPEGLSEANSSLSTPLHWASLNKHLATVQKLVNHTPGPGANLIDQKNKAGRTPLGEAEMAGWEEGAQWMVSVMNLTTNSSAPTEEDEEDVEFDGKDIEVEIEDADGGIARMTLQSGKDATVVATPPERNANAGSDAPA